MTLKSRKQHYRRTPGRCQACGSRLITGDWHKPGSGGSIQCAHCRPKFVSNPETRAVDQIIDLSPDQAQEFTDIVQRVAKSRQLAFDPDNFCPTGGRFGCRCSLCQPMRPPSKFCESGSKPGCSCSLCF